MEVSRAGQGVASHPPVGSLEQGKLDQNPKIEQVVRNAQLASVVSPASRKSNGREAVYVELVGIFLLSLYSPRTSCVVAVAVVTAHLFSRIDKANQPPQQEFHLSLPGEKSQASLFHAVFALMEVDKCFDEMASGVEQEKEELLIEKQKQILVSTNSPSLPESANVKQILDTLYSPATKDIQVGSSLIATPENVEAGIPGVHGFLSAASLSSTRAAILIIKESPLLIVKKGDRALFWDLSGDFVLTKTTDAMKAYLVKRLAGVNDLVPYTTIMMSS